MRVGTYFRLFLKLVAVSVVFYFPKFAFGQTATKCSERIEIELGEPVQDQATFYVTLFADSGSHTHHPAKFHFTPPTFYNIRDVSEKEFEGVQTILPNHPTAFKISLRPNNPGLLTIDFIADWNLACSNHHPFNANFQNKVQISTTSPGFVAEDSAPVDSKTDLQPLTLGANFLQIRFLQRNDHSPITFGSPPTLEISATDDDTALLNVKDRTRTRSVLTTMDANGGASATVECNKWDHLGALQVKVLKGSDLSTPIAVYFIKYRTEYPWFILIGATFLGALLYVLIESLPTLNKVSGTATPNYWQLIFKDGGSKIILALSVSLVVFLLKDTNIFDAIKFNATSLRGYAILGFCTNVFGLEAIFKKIKKLVDPS